MPKTTKGIGKLIFEMRKAAGMSQMALAAKVGVTYQQIQKYEKGKSQLSVPRLKNIANAFGVPVTAFIEEKVEAGQAREGARFSNLSKDEGTMINLYRKMPKKSYRTAFLKILKDIVRLAESD